MSCKIAYICGKQGLSIIPLLTDITESGHLKIFASPSAYNEWVGDCAEMSPITSNDMLKAAITDFRPDIILVMTYLSRLDVSLSKSSRYGMVNIHPSLLPKYRGGAPIFHALKNGEAEVGVTYHFIAEEFDQGDIIHQSTIKVSPLDCASSVWLKVIRKIVAALPGLIARRTQWAYMATKQDDNVATSAEFPSKEERSLSVHKCVAENLGIIRGCGRASGAPLSLKTHTIFVTEASVAHVDTCSNETGAFVVSDKNKLLVKATDGWLQIDTAEFDSMPISSWEFMMAAKDNGI